MTIARGSAISASPTPNLVGQKADRVGADREVEGMAEGDETAAQEQHHAKDHGALRQCQRKKEDDPVREEQRQESEEREGNHGPHQTAPMRRGPVHILRSSTAPNKPSGRHSRTATISA